jgi:tetratricopeptide (TPR) repeat protein
MPTFVIVLLSILPVFYISLFLHELGHVICARLTGWAPTSVGMGTGRLFLVVPVGGCRVYFSTRKPFQGGNFTHYPRLLPTRWRKAGVIAGGGLANTLVTALSLASVAVLPSAAVILFTFAGVNAFFALTALIPFSTRVGPTTAWSDGALILRVLRGRRLAGAGDYFRLLHALSGLWRESGDLKALRVFTVSAAALWSKLGDAARARELLEEARGIAADIPPTLRIYEKLVAAEAALAAGDLAAAGSQMDEVEAEFRALHHPAGLLLTALARGRWLLSSGDAAAALACYESIEVDPLLRGQDETIRAEVYRQQLICRRAVQGGKGTDEPLIEYDLPRSFEPLPLLDLLAYKGLAEVYARIGRNRHAAAAYGRALDAVAALDAAISEPDRERFRASQSGLIRATQDSLRANGEEEEAARLDTFFAPAGVEEKDVKNKEQDPGLRKKFRRGVALALLNLAVVVAVWLLVPPYPEQTAPSLAAGQPNWTRLTYTLCVSFGTSLMGISTACGLGLGLLGAAASRSDPRFRALGANLILTLSMLPWAIILLFLMLLTAGKQLAGW